MSDKPPPSPAAPPFAPYPAVQELRPPALSPELRSALSSPSALGVNPTDAAVLKATEQIVVTVFENLGKQNAAEAATEKDREQIRSTTEIKRIEGATETTKWGTVVGGIVALCLIGLVAYALSLGKDAFAERTLQFVGVFLAGGASGWGVARVSEKKKTEGD